MIFFIHAKTNATVLFFDKNVYVYVLHADTSG